MEKYVIKGGRKLSGSITTESAKNSVLPILAASIMTDQEVIIENCPKIKDVLSMVKILSSLGVKTCFQENNLIINAENITGYTIPENLGKELRASVFMIGALLSRVKKANVSYPGGCEIGLRPIDIHIAGLKELGVIVTETCGQIFCRAEKICGREIYLDFPSVGATENLMLAAVLSKGKTEIHNPAKEPEIIDLMKFLNSMGAKVYGAGTSIILIEGVEKLHGTTYKPMPDRIEAGTYLVAAAITGGEIEVKNCPTKNISSLVHKLCNNTCKISIKNDIIYLKSGKSGKPFSLTTGPYPFFPTDLQPQITSLACVADGTSVITENVFDGRFKYVAELIKMGAEISVKERTAIVSGVRNLYGAFVKASDLRGGAALVIAALKAEGKTVISDIKHVERGYYLMDEKLRILGAELIKK